MDSTVPWPNGTCDTSMTFVPGLYGMEPCPCVLVVGGENDEGKTLSDCWILDLRSTTWTQVRYLQVVCCNPINILCLMISWLSKIRSTVIY